APAGPARPRLGRGGPPTDHVLPAEARRGRRGGAGPRALRRVPAARGTRHLLLLQRPRPLPALSRRPGDEAAARSNRVPGGTRARRVRRPAGGGAVAGL